MKLFVTYAVLFILAIALFELGQRTSIHIFSQMGLVVLLTSLVIVVRTWNALVRDIRQFG